MAWLEVGVKTLPLQCQNSLQKATDLQEMWPNNLDASSIKDQSTREKKHGCIQMPLKGSEKILELQIL